MQFAFRDSFPPGEAIAASGRCRTGGATGFQIQQSDKLKIEILSWGYFVFFHFFRGKLFPTAKKAAKELIL
jgi:hypothetical protein